MEEKGFVSRRELVDLFVSMARIGSPTGKVGKFRDFLGKEILSLGFLGGEDAHGNLVFRTKEFDPERSILLTTHMDTVSPGEGIRPRISGDFILSDGTTVLGADPKGGIAALIFALRSLSRGRMAFRDIELVFSTNEEEGEHTLIHADARSKKALVLDNSTGLAEVIRKTPFAKVFIIRAKGKEVYAQAYYDRGRNAIASLAETVSRSPWGYFKQGCVANTGTISGGTATTLVPKLAELKGNAYCFDKGDLDGYMSDLARIADRSDRKFGTQTDISVTEEYVGSFMPPRDELVLSLRRIYRSIGVGVRFREKLLVGPENCLAAKGIQALNLGIGYSECHTVNERQSISDLEKLVKVIAAFVRERHRRSL